MARLNDEKNRIYNSYNIISGLKNKFGEYKKVEFHLHTTASHDYKLFDNCIYKNLTIDEIISKGISEGLLTDEFLNHIKNRFDLKVDNCQNYEDLKELVSYCLIAMKLYKENIEVAIVCDHNTVDGFYKVEYAANICLSWFFKIYDIPYLYILFGVEIGCSEEDHLICIQDRKYLNDVKNCLNDEIINCKEGSYRDSLYIMQEFWKNFKSVCYLAHQNTANNYGSGAYKKQLYSQNKMCLMGTTDKMVIEKIKDRIKKYVKDKEITFVYEGDAHEINSIGIKNTWIKMKKSDYKSFLRAVRNRNITIKLDEPREVTKQIKGMLVIQDENNFLAGDKDNLKNLMINFSPELNCIIGGRGTGKSTILNLIDIAMSKQCDNLDKLIFISKNKCVDFLIEVDNREFIINFIPQIKDIDKYYYLPKEELLSDINIKKNDIIELGDRWITGYEIKDEKVILMKQTETDEILRKVFRRSYNVNKLVNLVENNKIEQFLDEVISYGISDGFVDSIESKLDEISRKSYKKYIRENIDNINNTYLHVKEKLKDMIEEFNTSYSSSIKVVLKDDSINSYDYLKFLKLENSTLAFQESNLTWGDISKYIFDISKKIGYFNFIYLLLNEKYSELNKTCNIYKYVDYEDRLYTRKLINNKNIQSFKLKEIFKPIEKNLFDNRKEMNESIIGCLKMNKKFTLEFNVNNKERVSTDKPILMKDIKLLSLGQKVVALLSFVFEFGKFSGDNSILIIDQPEDNLDNQYIYKNLVNNLKNIKNERQVIIVTHSSTIVTNADAEQVIVMESDNEKAWIAKSGYPEDKTIVQHILNYLEGGIESFKHKKGIYNVYIM
ncbi:MAG TPA: hypothetical protein DG753_10195 [Clostridium sp.]|nr:hypothetical protein [Clostridium sp.]